MGKSFFDLLLTLLKVRKDRAMAQSQRVNKDLNRVQGFKNQLDSYAKEYEAQWLMATQKGETVAQLQVQMAFGSKLRATAQAQEPELKLLQEQARRARAQALSESERYKTVKAFKDRQRQRATAVQAGKEQKELEDLIQARYKAR